jgi:hypothetical protein
MSSIKVVLKNAVGVKAATKHHYYMHLLNWRFQTWICLNQCIIWWFCLLMNLWIWEWKKILVFGYHITYISVHDKVCNILSVLWCEWVNCCVGSPAGDEHTLVMVQERGITFGLLSVKTCIIQSTCEQQIICGVSWSIFLILSWISWLKNKRILYVYGKILHQYTLKWID